MSLVKADLGAKRVCPNCSARFYDLRKRPIECPKCDFAFDPESLYKQRRPRQPEAEKPVAERAAVTEDEGLEAAEETEAEEAEDAVIEDEEAPALETGEEEEVVVEDEEPEAAGMSVVEPEAEEVEIEAIEDEEIAEEGTGDAALLEDVGEEEDDVSAIIDADIEKDER